MLNNRIACKFMGETASDIELLPAIVERAGAAARLAWGEFFQGEIRNDLRGYPGTISCNFRYLNGTGFFD